MSKNSVHVEDSFQFAMQTQDVINYSIHQKIKLIKLTWYYNPFKFEWNQLEGTLL